MLRTLLALLSLAALSHGSAAAQAPVEPRIWAYQYVFATASSAREVDPLLQHLRLEPELVGDLRDYIAEALVSPLNRDMESDARLLLARFLFKAGEGRYLQCFERLRSEADNPELLATTQNYLRRYRKTRDVQYVPGTLDIAAIRANYAAAAQAMEPTDTLARKLASLPPESSIDELVALAGLPQAVVSGQTRATDGLLIHIRIQRLSFYYRGVGRVVFGFRKYDRWRSQGVVIDPEAFEALMPYRPRPLSRVASTDEALGFTQLLNGHPMAMKVAVESRWRTGGASAAFLDATAELLLQQHSFAQTPDEFDLYAWMCRLLGSYGGARYADVLATVARDTRDEKLRRFASLPVATIPNAATAPYVSGSVPLAQLRAQYPPLYPQRTFLSGAL